MESGTKATNRGRVVSSLVKRSTLEPGSRIGTIKTESLSTLRKTAQAAMCTRATGSSESKKEWVSCVIAIMAIFTSESSSVTNSTEK